MKGKLEFCGGRVAFRFVHSLRKLIRKIDKEN